MTVIAAATRPPHATLRRAAVACVAALAMVVAACGAPARDGAAVDRPPPTGAGDGAPDASDGSATPSEPLTDADTPTVPFVLHLDLDLEEPPTEEPGSLDEKLEQSGYLEVAPEPDQAVLAQRGCADLADMVVELHQDLLDAVGDADRTDIAAVDTAFERHGVNGVLVARHADQLGCEIDEMTRVICGAKTQLTPRGDVGRDIIDLSFGSC